MNTNDMPTVDMQLHGFLQFDNSVDVPNNYFGLSNEAYSSLSTGVYKIFTASPDERKEAIQETKRAFSDSLDKKRSVMETEIEEHYRRSKPKPLSNYLPQVIVNLMGVNSENFQQQVFHSLYSIPGYREKSFGPYEETDEAKRLPFNYVQLDNEETFYSKFLFAQGIHVRNKLRKKIGLNPIPLEPNEILYGKKTPDPAIEYEETLSRKPKVKVHDLSAYKNYSLGFRLPPQHVYRETVRQIDTSILADKLQLMSYRTISPNGTLLPQPSNELLQIDDGDDDEEFYDFSEILESAQVIEDDFDKALNDPFPDLKEKNLRNREDKMSNPVDRREARFLEEFSGELDSVEVSTEVLRQLKGDREKVFES
eukprot:TRINITY_DN9473_c0_g1_i1.p1 TRINITY_DN9473_c0_g1~~TRINITY_DN9473_c0_g1_i1.p1  ORF type:complete len:367 (-),score=69.79 TRINITY_DN9473_c0_g1_i1:31-1131(-)